MPQVDVGGASSTLELAQKAGVGPGMKGVELNCNNGGGMRALVRLGGVDSMIGVELTKSVVETGKKRTEEWRGVETSQTGGGCLNSVLLESTGNNKLKWGLWIMTG